ncbi:MAG: helix-turn-helix domain-containing protein [Pseudobutyrivibrio sp.]|nr:helix-turn-helix domain-containing protein [Pseudobutyrivibrio sp.]
MESNSKREKVKVRVSDKKIEMEHFHQDIELCYVLQGRAEIEMGQECVVLFSEGVYLINANKKHSIRLSEDGLLVKVSVSFELLSDVLGSLDVQFICNSNLGDNEQYEALRKQIKRLLTHYVNTNGNVADFGHIALCYEFLDVLTVNFQVRNSDKRGKEDDLITKRINQINNYVRGNYKGQLSLKDLADKLYLSEAYLSRFFKKTYGMTFLKYVTNIRVTHAYESLLYTDEPVTKIAYDNGFSTVTLFNKTFKQIYGQTPSELRKQRSVSISDSNSSVDKKLQTKLEDILQSGAKNEEYFTNTSEIFVTCNLKNSDTNPLLHKNFRYILNAGNAEELLSAEIRDHIATLAEVLHFEYIRFWNIFTPSMLLTICENDGQYNFSKIDGIIDFILQQGLKPVLELGFKPKRIQASVRQPIVKAAELTDLRYEPKFWGKMVSNFFTHLNDCYGSEEVATWMAELWYDERADLIPGYDYYEIFNNTASIIRGINKRIRIGGCGIREDSGDAWMEQFFYDWRSQEQQPDYISMIHFPYVSGEIKNDLYSRRNTDNDSFVHAIERVRNSMNKAGFSEDIKLYATEWSNTISDRNAINDSCYKGAFVVRNLIQNMTNVDGIGYFQATDRTVQYSDTNAFLFGGTGLITKDSILKPAAFAYEFMNRLKPYIVAKGREYIVSMDENESFIIVCNNQKRLNYNYYLTDEGDINKAELWKYYEDNDSLSIDFKINDVSFDKYKARVYRVNEDYGSILDIWKGLGFDNNLTKNDIRFCRRICEPHLTIDTGDVVDGVLDFNIKLKANEIACISLKKTQ